MAKTMPKASETAIVPGLAPVAGSLTYHPVEPFAALAALADVELDLLALIECLVSFTNDVRKVHEHIVAAIAGDESEALVVVEELHGTYCHYLYFLSAQPTIVCDRDQSEPTGPR